MVAPFKRDTTSGLVFPRYDECLHAALRQQLFPPSFPTLQHALCELRIPLSFCILLLGTFVKATRSSFVDMVSVELSAASVEDIGRLGFSYFQVPVEIGSTSTLPSSAVPDPCVSVTREVPCEQIDG